ncbi:MAG TPA: MTH938/NDUFAF3 family protein [Steroidobacteraceae bacterium]|jgi:uncharacterized protein|nr:MTH938/NDUFAF3 family protein [Steroidobacteraceae bacterium]
MRLALESDPNIHLIRSYGDGRIAINDESLTHPCIVSPRSLVRDWPATSVAALDATLFEPLLAGGAQIILLGEGETQQFPPSELRKLCRSRGIALESMNLGAACRTYNILANEGRAIVAGLFP